MKKIRVRIKRIAVPVVEGVEYGDDVFITQCGIHLEKDTMGSRQETVK